MPANIQSQNQQPGQESVWDYPRPPRVEPVDQPIRVIFNGVTIAETQQAQRVLETSHPPVYYIPPEDIHMEYLTPTARKTYCEFKGAASYWTLKVGERVSENVGWSYAQPQPGYESLKGCIAFYASRVDAMLRRRRAGAAAAERLLRRLDHGEDRGTVQGRAGDRRLVNAADSV